MLTPTPGPWAVRKVDRHTWAIDAAGWLHFVEVFGNQADELQRQGKANARLIGAAPDLLDAAKRVMADIYEVYNPRADSIDALGEAIAKALGKKVLR